MEAPTIHDLHFEPAVPVTVKVNPEKVWFGVFGLEAEMLVETEEKSYLAAAPKWAFSEDLTTVKAARVGRLREKVLISFPPTLHGTSTLYIPEDQLPAVLVG